MFKKFNKPPRQNKYKEYHIKALYNHVFEN